VEAPAPPRPITPVARYVRAGTLVFVFVLGFLVFRHFLVTFTVAASIALLIKPLHDRLTAPPPGDPGRGAAHRDRLPAAGPAGGGVRDAGEQAAGRAHRLAAAAARPEQLRTLSEEGLLGRLERSLGWLPVDRDAISSFLSTSLTRIVDAANRLAQNVLGGLATFLANLVLFLFMLFFLLRDGDRLVAEIRNISPLGAEREREITDHLGRTIKGIVAAQVLVPIAQGLVALPGFALVGLPSPLFWSAMVVFGALIPLVGAPLVWVPAAIYMLVQVSVGRGIAAFLYGFAGDQPPSTTWSSRWCWAGGPHPPLLGFLAILGGILSFGPAGFVVGPVILSLVLSAIRIYRLDVWGS